MASDEGSTFVFREEDHHLNCCEQVEELWRQRAFCDVNLIVENTEGKPTVSIPAHRIILAAAVPYFRGMLTSEMQEALQSEVTLRNVDEEGLKKVVSYAYSGKVEISEGCAQGILATASMLGLPKLVRACANFIAKHITPANCLGITAFSLLYDLQGLHTTASRFAMDKFATVWREEEFLGLSVDKVEYFVQSDQICVNSEEDVYEAVTRWIQHDEKMRNQHADRLYNHVRFPIIDGRFLKNAVMQNPLITSSNAGKLMIQEALDYHENPASVILFSNPKKTQPRSSVMGVICVVGGAGDAGQSLNEVTFFSPHEKQWRSGPKMLQHRSRLAIALFQGELYAIGGADFADSLSSVEKYSPTTNCWGNVAALNTPRRSCAAVVTPRGIFVLGGYSGSVYLKSVELYDSELDEWSYQLPMTESRSELCAVFFDQRIYAIGGYNSSGQLKSVERFDLINRKWEKVADMCAPRANAGIIAPICAARDVFSCKQTVNIYFLTKSFCFTA